MTEAQPELFNIEDSISPMNAFIVEHDIHSCFDSGMESEIRWGAYFGDLTTFTRFDCMQGAPTKQDAILLLAKKYDLEGWKNLNWG